MYEFKVRPEVAWAVAVAVLTPLLVALSTFDPEQITDWRVWAIGVGAAMVRALGGALLAVLTSPERGG